MTGIFSSAVIMCPHFGQRERGVTRLNGLLSLSAVGLPSISLHWCFHSRSIITGKRWMTTLRKLPSISPNKKQAVINTAWLLARISAICMRDYTTSPSLKIGRYIATTMPPMRPPSTTMIMGSMRLLSASTASSTSDS